MARTFMVHYSFHWKNHDKDDISLWSFAVKHYLWLHNRLPNYSSGITPIYILTINKADHLYLRKLHVWVCTVFVLNPKLKMIKIYQIGIGALT